MKNVMLFLRELLSEIPTEVLQTKDPGQLMCHPGSCLFFSPYFASFSTFSTCSGLSSTTAAI